MKKTYKGIAQGNIIVLQEPLDLPDHSEVIVTVTPRKKEIRKAFGVWKDRTDLEELTKLTKEPYENRERPRLTARGLLRSGLIGLWKDRKDISDSAVYARQLREQAQRRRG